MPRYAALSGLLGSALAVLSIANCSAQKAVVIQAMRGSENHLFIPISINGQKESWWLVDTGAPMSTIAEEAAATASLKAPAPGSNVRASVKSEGQELKVVVASDILSEGFDFGPQPLAVLRLDAVGGTGRFI